jgi:hypothetical protein
MHTESNSFEDSDVFLHEETLVEQQFLSFELPAALLSFTIN